ncbi:hypothetical protein [Microbacterium hominis]|uniref:Uncharacterized protein n=1 Tax=Microbacterium hominis TaxID=162426 RepID=A0A7D4Q089_9MICO|nr:hypothetical protein [Microbacterium hominis]QKJ18738.1 hypothetical protein HQM25_04625 [Microbacterium hominis]
MRRTAEGGARGFSPWWTAPTAWGAGLIEAAVGAATITSPGVAPAAWGVGATLVLLGLAALAWGCAGLARGWMPAPRAAVATAIAGMGALAAPLLTVPGRTSPLAVAAGIALLAVTAIGAAGAARQDRHRQPLPVVRMTVVAAVIALIVTPVLGSAQDIALAGQGGPSSVSPAHSGH